MTKHIKFPEERYIPEDTVSNYSRSFNEARALCRKSVEEAQKRQGLGEEGCMERFSNLLIDNDIAMNGRDLRLLKAFIKSEIGEK